MIRKAVESDLDEVSRIYEEIHTEEEQGRMTIGWIRGIYPTRKTAEAALARDDLYVLEEENAVIGAGIINQIQVEEYRNGRWLYPARADEIMVLHTLVISPKCGKRGYGQEFVRYYEMCARKSGCTCLRMDTNEKNKTARQMYRKMGYREADTVPCNFNGIPGVRLVLLEKKIEIL